VTHPVHPRTPAAGPETPSPVTTAWPALRPPPDVTFPSPPAEFVPQPAGAFNGFRPLQTEVAAAPDAALELERFTDWDQVFGVTAPPAALLARKLQIASQWSSLLAQTEAWLAYVKSEEGQAWMGALEAMDALKVPFQLATATHASLLAQCPHVATLLGAHRAQARRAMATRRRKAAAAASAREGEAIAASADPGASCVAAAAPTPSRMVTVTG